jgi:hypothetical protein
MGDLEMNAQPQTIEEKIAAKIDTDSANSLTVSEKSGGLAFQNADQAMNFARMMAVSSVAVPKHLRGNPGACLAVVIQAIEWRLSPYAVANKSYSVNDRLAFESQLIQAVILQRAPIKGRLKVEYTGEGPQRICRVWAELKDTGEIVEYYSPPFAKITPKNSPLWVSDPDQQQFYYSARSLCRRHFPDVLLGIYARDELEDSPRIGPDRARDVTPAKTIAEKLDVLAKHASEAEHTHDANWIEAAPYVADEFAGQVAFEGVPELVPDEPEPDMFEPIRERARADAEKRIRRMAPTALSEVEKEVYLRAFDLHRTAMAE